ncbi:MAG: dTMP kinase [Cyanobacteria bacterium J06641_5]
MSGKLIVFEGIEGSGKSTQIARVLSWLQASELGQQVPIVATREPGGTLLGSKLRQLLLSASADRELVPCERAELLLYAADRAQHVETVLKPQLERGAIVLCDRFSDSTIAYQGYGRGLSLSEIEQIDRIATGHLASDLTIWLDVDVELGQQRARQRGQLDRIEQAELAFHRRVRQGFVDLAATYPNRIARVDANRSESAVDRQVRDTLERAFERWSS